MRKGMLLTACLLLTCWLAQASEPGPISPEPSSEQPMVPLATCEAELRQLEQKSIEQVTQLEADFETRLRLAVTAAAAETAKPLLVELAGVTAERDAARQRVGRLGFLAAIIGFAIGVIGGVLTLHVNPLSAILIATSPATR